MILKLLFSVLKDIIYTYKKDVAFIWHLMFLLL